MMLTVMLVAMRVILMMMEMMNEEIVRAYYIPMKGF